MARRKNRDEFGVARKRVQDLLDEHMSMLEKKNRTFEAGKEGCAYYLNELPHPREDDYLRVGYTRQKKLLTRTFNFEITTTVNEVHFEDSFDLRVKFTGFPHIQTSYFKGGKGQKEYEEIFNDEKLLEIIRKNACIVDIGYIRVTYDRAASKLTLRICPYPGAYLWVIFPPVFYKIPLKQEEVDALWRIATELRKFATKLED